MKKNKDFKGGLVLQQQKNMGDGNRDSADSTSVVVALERSVTADVCATTTMNPTCSTSTNKSRKRPDSLRFELLRIHDESVRNSCVYGNPNDLNISFRNVSYTVKHGVFLNSK